MSVVSFNNLSFHYNNPYRPIFSNLSFSFTTEWKTGLTGKNGRGKTTILKLLTKELEPSGGNVSCPGEILSFPYNITNKSLIVLDIIKNSIAPFAKWEQKMEDLLSAGSEESLQKYSIVYEKFTYYKGYEIDSLIEKEAEKVGLDSSLIYKNFEHLSGGEQTRALIIPLFLRPGIFPVIDEPTDHLDLHGRKLLAEYLLRKKSGFLLVSHDRFLLDYCTDHIIELQRDGVRIFEGNYSTLKYQSDLENESEHKRSENLQKVISKLESSAAKRRSWSITGEKEKNSSADSGFVSHKASKVMKRALSIEKRINSNIEEKKGLLKNFDTEKKLLLPIEQKIPDILLSIENISIIINNREIVRNFSLSLRKGERIALCGKNGCGKTSVLNAVDGTLRVNSGSIYFPKYIHYSRAYQLPLWNQGNLRAHLENSKIEETRFRFIMAAFGMTGELFNNPLENLSRGELRKIDLCRSFVSRSHFFIWDEPLNYLDINSREQLQEVICEFEPTLLFVEHDKYFIDQVATQIIEM